MFPALVAKATGGFFLTYPTGGKMQNEVQSQLPEILTRGVDQVLPSAVGLNKLMAEKKIRLYLGIDPTGNQLHLGHAVVLRKLQQFAEAGHEVILLIGNGTVKIGDPTGRDKTRPVLTDEDIESNFVTWRDQASKILDFGKITLRKNGDWLDAMTFPQVVKLMSHATVQQLMERDMFQERLKNNLPIFAHEMMYPLLQGYDSVVMDVDLELGGNDQLFNMMVGRQLQHEMNGREKFVLTVPLLVGSDGRKMGKSFGNFISLTETPENMFGKLMSVVDEVIPDYLRLLSNFSLAEIEEMEAKLQTGELHPMEAKKLLALDITAQYHSVEAAQAAQEHFQKTVQNQEIPEDLPLIQVSGELSTLDLVMGTGAFSSRSEARRLIEQGGVELAGQKLLDPFSLITAQSGQVLRAGKRRWFRVE